MNKFNFPTVKLTYENPQPFSERKKLSGLFDTVDIFRESFEHCMEHHEEFHVLLLCNALRVLGIFKGFSGGITETAIDIRIIMQAVILSNATRIVIAHNHPSGCILPSEQDKRITDRMNEVCKFHYITLVDHLILTREEHYSFAENFILT